MFYVNMILPCKILTPENHNFTETIFLEVDVQSSSQPFMGCYKPPGPIEGFFDPFSTKYDIFC